MENGQTPELRQQMRLQTMGYILGALGLVAGLAWNEAITALINALFPFAKDGIWIKFVYAGVITLFVIFIALFLQRLIMSKKED